MKQVFFVIIVAGSLAGCADISAQKQTVMPDVSAGERMRPKVRPDALDTTARPVSTTARTVEQFDTTTKAERVAAEIAPPTVDNGALGRTVVSLGDPAKPGFWMKTPLISKGSMGRVVSDATGKAVQVELIPIDGPKTAGSRMSLAALRVLGVPLTDLAEVAVYKQ